MAASAPSTPASPEEGQVIDDFVVMEQIGAGAFSRVHLAQHLPTGNFAAVKIIDLSRLAETEAASVIREVSVFLLVSHPNICSLYRFSTFHRCLLLFMEFVPGGTLLEAVAQKKSLGEQEARLYFVQIFAAIRHLHLFHFLAHRDLKLENVLVGKRGVIKVADFGLAGTAYNNLMHTFVGTPGFQAPEIIAGNEYSEKCDVWSLAVCLYAMVAGRLPFSTQSQNYRLFLSEIMKIQYPPQFSPALQDFLKKMFIIKPDERPNMIQLQSHPWLKGLEQLSLNIAPQPVFFPALKSLSSVTKLKRRKTVAKPEVLERCAALGLDPAQVAADLLSGETTAGTASYFVLCNPVSERPEIRRPPPRSDTAPNLEAEDAEQLPVLNPKAAAARRIAPSAHTQTHPIGHTMPRAGSKGQLARMVGPRHDFAATLGPPPKKRRPL
jgi:serine/threonine protein kinase